MGGVDPLLSASENCSNMVDLPTEEEKENAITGNMSRVVAVVRIRIHGRTPN